MHESGVIDFPCNGLDWKRDLKEKKKKTTVFTKVHSENILLCLYNPNQGAQTVNQFSKSIRIRESLTGFLPLTPW